MASRHRIVVALVGEAPFRTEGSTSRRLFFLDGIAVASPQWQNGLNLCCDLLFDDIVSFEMWGSHGSEYHLCYSRSWCRIWLCVITNVSEERIARLKCSLVGGYQRLYGTSTLKMEVIRSSETLVTTYKTTRHHNLEDHNRDSVSVSDLLNGE
jgi:hypothetical protein